MSFIYNYLNIQKQTKNTSILQNRQIDRQTDGKTDNSTDKHEYQWTRKKDIVKLCRNKQQPSKTFFRHAKEKTDKQTHSCKDRQTYKQ